MKHPVFRLIKKIAYIVFPKYKVIGMENIPDGPAVVIGNHSQAHGPVSVELYFPGEHYTWCIAEMMEKDKVAEYAYRDFWSKKPVIIRPFFKLVAHLIPSLSEIVFTNADTLPVYKDKRVFKTFQLSVEKLEQSAKIVIFPEEYTEYNNIVHRFQRGFAYIGKYYYRQEGQDIPFVPMYVCPARGELIFGEPIYYDHTNKSEEEAERICGYLQDAISEIAYSLPRHRVVPYPNVSKKKYPYNERLL